MVSIGDGLRMMQGGVDRTGYAGMADAIGNPGLDLIRQRRAEADQQARLQALLDAMMLGDDGSTEDPKLQVTSGFNPDTQMQNTFPTTFAENVAQSISDYADFKPEVEEVIENIIEAPGEGVQFIKDELTEGVKPDEFATPLNVIGDVYRETAPFVTDVLKGGGNLFLEQYNKLLNTPIEDYEYETDFFKYLFGGEGGGPESVPIGGMQNGGRVHLQGGGMDAGAGSLSGDKGFGAGVSRGVQDRMNRGGNKQGKINIPDKEVDIDQLSMPSVSNYMGITNIDPKMMYSIGPTMQMQPPVDETSAFDQFSKYNLLDQTFDVAPGLTFGYNINPSLKNLGDLDAEANLIYSFNQGGNVSGKISDDEKSLRLSDEDKFIQAQTVGDTDLYDYLIGGEITPGLNFELGLMDDEITDPLGMTPREDYKFFRLIKEF